VLVFNKRVYTVQSSVVLPLAIPVDHHEEEEERGKRRDHGFTKWKGKCMYMARLSCHMNRMSLRYDAHPSDFIYA
jgi:hypothetical protein